MKFYYGSLVLDVPDGVYYPREDSLLMAKVIEAADLQGKTVLEIGCGSGFLSILMAKMGAHVTAVDINEEAVGITRINAKNNGVFVDCYQSDLFSSIDGRFDVIVFNPPYLPVQEDDKTYAGGLTGREAIERFAAAAKAHLKPDGFILLVISSLTGEKEVIELFEKEGTRASVEAREKVPWEELIVIKAVTHYIS